MKLSLPCSLLIIPCRLHCSPSWCFPRWLKDCFSSSVIPQFFFSLFLFLESENSSLQEIRHVIPASLNHTPFLHTLPSSSSTYSNLFFKKSLPLLLHSYFYFYSHCFSPPWLYMKYSSDSSTPRCQ